MQISILLMNIFIYIFFYMTIYKESFFILYSFIHYAPILNNNKLVAKLIKSDIILEINDQESY